METFIKANGRMTRLMATGSTPIKMERDMMESGSKISSMAKVRISKLKVLRHGLMEPDMKACISVARNMEKVGLCGLTRVFIMEVSSTIISMALVR